MVGAVGYSIYAATSGKEFNWGHFALATGGGLAAGALIGTGVGWAAGVSQATATTAAITTAGVIESANVGCGGDMCASEVQNLNQVTPKILPAIGNTFIKISTSINTGTNVVYRAVEDGVTKYIGITNNFQRRAAQHLQNGRIIEPIKGLVNLNRFDVRAVEQVLIEQYGLKNLQNIINSISSLNPIYQQAIQRGKDILNLLK